MKIIPQEYRDMFRSYPDVVTVEILQEMLGDIGRNTAYLLLKEGVISSVRIGRNYRIPKVCVLEYLYTSSQKKVRSE